jgi:hypothetical protein
MSVHNGMDVPIRNLNLRSVWENLEPDQGDVVTLDADETIDFRCNDPNQHLFRRRFKAAVEAAGGDSELVTFGPYAPPEE